MVRLVAGFIGQAPLLRIFLLQQAIDSIKARLPESALESQPFLSRLQACGGQSAMMFPSPHFSTDQAGAFQHFHMLGYSRAADFEWSGKAPNCRAAPRQLSQYGPSRSIGKGEENLIEMC